MPVVGFVNSGGASPQAGRADAFRKGLNEANLLRCIRFVRFQVKRT
jgi:hypothetical protein